MHTWVRDQTYERCKPAVYVCMYVCMYACMYVCIHTHMYVCIHTHEICKPAVYVCMQVCMYVYIRTQMHCVAHSDEGKLDSYSSTRASLFKMYYFINMYIYTYTYIQIHTHMHDGTHSDEGKLDSYSSIRASLSKSWISGYCSHTSERRPEDEGALEEISRSRGTDTIT